MKQVGEFIRQQRSGAGVSLRKLAKAAGVSNPYLSQVERGLRRPSAEILQAIAKGLRVSSQTLYVQAGILDEQPIPDVHTAIMGDATLTERQKHVLIDIYESFREETGRRVKSAKRSAARSSRRPSTKASPNGAGGAKTARAAVRRSRSLAKAGGRTETQADPSPHPAPLRPSASKRKR